MNILIYTMSTPKPNGGGVSRMTCSISNGLKAQGHEVYYLCFEVLEVDSVLENTYYFPVLKSPMTEGNKAYLRQFLNEKNIGFVINQIPLNEKFAGLLYDVKPQGLKIASVIHNSSLNMVRQYAYSKEYELRKQGKTYIFSLLKFWPIKQFLIVSYIRKHRNHYQKMEKASDYIVAVSYKNKEDIYSLIGFRSPKVISINNFVKVTNESIPEKEKLVIWCGRLETSNKRVDMMIDIWTRVCKYFPDWKLVIMGFNEGSDIEDYAHKVEAENVIFTGPVNTEEYYKPASIVCHTSISESFGLVIVEAMNWGCVPMAFDSFPTCQDIIPDDCGYRIKAFDKKAYIRCLKNLMANAEERMQKSKASKSYSQQFNTENSIKEWVKIIETK